MTERPTGAGAASVGSGGEARVGPHRLAASELGFWTKTPVSAQAAGAAEAQLPANFWDNSALEAALLQADVSFEAAWGDAAVVAGSDKAVSDVL